MPDRNEKHPAYGKIAVTRVQGQADLFQVDYPQQHFIKLTISTASLERKLSNDWVYDDQTLVEINMSEVQWARLLSSMNTTGVPCTLGAYIDPNTKQYIRPRMPSNVETKTDTFKSEIRETVGDGMNALKDLLTQLKTLSAPGTSTKKSDIAALTSKAETVYRELMQNLPYVMEQADEAIESAVEAGKGEIAAFIDHSMQKLGERALGEKATEYTAEQLGAVARTLIEHKE